MNESRSLLVVLSVVLNLTLTKAADTNAVLESWFAAQENLHTWSADFTQTRTLQALTQPLTATGHVWFAKPNRFRWELGHPAQTIALRQTDQMWVIYPFLKRAERYPLEANTAGQWRDVLSLLDAGFPQNRSDMESRFHVLSITSTNAAWEVRLEPARATARRMMTEIRIGLATNDFSLTFTELVFADGSRLRNDFNHAVANEKLDESLFQWRPPPDFKVTEPLTK